MSNGYKSVLVTIQLISKTPEFCHVTSIVLNAVNKEVNVLNSWPSKSSEKIKM